MELYDPGTRTWKLGPAQAEGRSYHSTAVLLPDGSVLSAGDDRLPQHALDSYEIYKPPYFFQGERPVISSSPSSSAWNRTIWVGTPDADIARAVLVAPSATTHAVEMHQRVVNLPARKRADGAGYDVDMPTSTNVALPGHHMLFLIDTQGRPSHAAWIRLDSSAPVQEPPSGGGGDTTPPPAPSASPAPGTYAADQSVSLSGEAGATIRYTIDGAVPTATTGTVYAAPISVTGAAGTSTTRTIRAVAVDAAGNASPAATLVYTIDKSTAGTRTLVVNADADAFVRQATPTTNTARRRRCGPTPPTAAALPTRTCASPSPPWRPARRSRARR
jgi:hypothetical protein